MILTNRTANQTEWNGSSWHVLTDEDVPGLFLRIRRDSKTFMIRYSIRGKKHKLAIGRLNPLTLEKARRIAREMLGKVAQGIDPRFADVDGGATMKKLLQSYMDLHARPLKKSWKEDDWRIKKYIPASWLPRPSGEISRLEVLELFRKVGEKYPYAANRLLRLLHKVFEYGRECDLFPENQRNPAEKIPLFHEEKRERYVTPREIPALIKAINEHPSERARAALWLIILTGCRKNEIIGAKWEDVDFDRNELRLPKTKSGRSHHVPLCEDAMKIIGKLKRRRHNSFLLGGKGSGTYTGIDDAWLKVRTDAEMPDIRIHDLRRTIGSWLASSNVSLHTIGRLLNHSSPKVTEVYARLADTTKREAVENFSRQLNEALSATPSSTPASRPHSAIPAPDRDQDG